MTILDNSKPRRQLGLFDATMIVMGGIVGAGIFANPSEVAHRVHTPFLILCVWVLGGLLAMCGAFIWAELATRLPGALGGQYVYLRDAYHPAVAFVYGWGLLLITQTGGMAAVAVIFASYFRTLTGVAWNESAIAAAVLLTLTGINCFGARSGSNVQSALMLLKIGAIAGLVIIGFAVGGHAPEHSTLLLKEPFSFDVLKGLGAAMVPIAFAYGGWQTATFVAAEIRNPRRDLSLGLLLGVSGVVALYLAVNVACLRGLGPAGLDATTTPALISWASRWAKAAPAGSRSRSQFPLSVSSAKACSPLRVCITRWRATDFSFLAWGNCSENRKRRSLQLFFRGSPQSSSPVPARMERF